MGVATAGVEADRTVAVVLASVRDAEFSEVGLWAHLRRQADQSATVCLDQDSRSGSTAGMARAPAGPCLRRLQWASLNPTTRIRNSLPALFVWNLDILLRPYKNALSTDIGIYARSTQGSQDGHRRSEKS